CTLWQLARTVQLSFKIQKLTEIQRPCVLILTHEGNSSALILTELFSYLDTLPLRALTIRLRLFDQLQLRLSCLDL
ncbi:hypothetical protein AOLI_G00286410, partial [Acnodon oligacanthus]